MAARKLYAERPGWGKDFDYDEGRHLVAYQYAARLARGRRVLDAGCGEGFCTQVLADIAAEVVGVDYSPEAVAVARELWHKPNLAFRVVDLARDPDDGDHFDVVLSFQVLEHIYDDLAFVRRLASKLNTGGLLVITTPNVLYSPSENPCHVREYHAEQLRALLGAVFTKVEILGTFGSAEVTAFDRRRKAAVERILKLDPLGLRRLLPRKFLFPIFAQLGRLVRRQAHKITAGKKITVDDFEIRPGDLREAMDLVALCRL